MLILCLFCLVFSFLVAVALGPLIIKLMVRLKAGQNILNYVDNHAGKQGTPTMCGLIFIFATAITAVFAFNGHYTLAVMAVVAFLAFGLLGFLDDFIKVRSGHNEGLKPYQKIVGQLGISIIFAIFVWNFVGGDIVLPFAGTTINIGFWIVPLVVVTFVALTNAVNLLDGLDGLCTGVSVAYTISFVAVLSVGLGALSTFWQVEQTNLIVVCFALVGALLAFEIFNGFPAKVFMGDTGSLAIGGLLSAAAVCTGMELFVLILGLPYVATALSVLLQVVHFKRTKKRIFLMAPLHHHFEKKGVHENKIVIVYIIITILIGVIAYAVSKFVSG